MALAEEVYANLVAAAERVAPYAIRLRQDLHRIPEPSGQEVETAARVAEELAKLDVTLKTGIAGTGVVADLATGRPGPFVLLRADMDALPMEDRSAKQYRSHRPGYSHSCGHDGHTAVLLGTVKVLAGLKESLAGRIRFVFQPAEERAIGAKAMLAAGLLADGRPDAVLALHAWPGLPTDTVGSRAGPIGASNDAFTIDIEGRGAHSARPDQGRSPLLGMARLIESLPTLSNSQRVVTICKARAGTCDNVIPEDGTLSGTSRAVDEDLRSLTKKEIEEQAISLCADVGLSASVSFREGCPAVVNDEDLFLQLRGLGDQIRPHLRVHEMMAGSMGGEDFAFFLREAPGLLMRLGTGVDSPHLHTSEFSFNDDAVPTGILAMGGMALRLCSRGDEGQ